MCVCVSVCVFGDDVRPFISDLGYAMQVIQHVKPMEGLHPGVRVSVHTLLCLGDW